MGGWSVCSRPSWEDGLILLCFSAPGCNLLIVSPWVVHTHWVQKWQTLGWSQIHNYCPNRVDGIKISFIPGYLGPCCIYGLESPQWAGAKLSARPHSQELLDWRNCTEQGSFWGCVIMWAAESSRGSAQLQLSLQSCSFGSESMPSSLSWHFVPLLLSHFCRGEWYSAS